MGDGSERYSMTENYGVITQLASNFGYVSGPSGIFKFDLALLPNAYLGMTVFFDIAQEDLERLAINLTTVSEESPAIIDILERLSAIEQRLGSSRAV